MDPWKLVEGAADELVGLLLTAVLVGGAVLVAVGAAAVVAANVLRVN